MATKVAPKKPPARAATDHVLYLYGITKGGTDRALRIAGIDGLAAVEPISCAGFTCWTSRVDRAEYADRLAENMEDLDWLASASLRHQQAVSELALAGTVLPARFGTVFLNAASLTRDVERRRAALLKAFRRVADADEWGVKVFAVSPAREQISAASGKDYLRQKAESLRSGARAPDPEVKKFVADLKRIAVEVAPGGAVSSGQAGLEWHGSALVRRSRVSQFERLIERYSERWRDRHRIESTGPWPPYSFVKNA
ncbi:MAG: GvpL/GvpF family gas vesicle protein [Acidobacteriales bacterium]|nr:GvpL/GvpF family gas vesicle protein [Terriglobales bacterium]